MDVGLLGNQKGTRYGDDALASWVTKRAGNDALVNGGRSLYLCGVHEVIKGPRPEARVPPCRYHHHGRQCHNQNHDNLLLDCHLNQWFIAGTPLKLEQAIAHQF